MITRIGNLIFSACALLVALGAWLGWRWAGSPERPAALDSVPMTIGVLLALCWLAAAIGLFFKSRLAWVGSLLGTGLSASGIAASVFAIIWIYVFPDAHMHRLRGLGSGGYIATLIIALAQFGGLLAAALALIIGLIKMRKTPPEAPVANQSWQPTPGFRLAAFHMRLARSGCTHRWL